MAEECAHSGPVHKPLDLAAGGEANARAGRWAAGVRLLLTQVKVAHGDWGYKKSFRSRNMIRQALLTTGLMVELACTASAQGLDDYHGPGRVACDIEFTGTGKPNSEYRQFITECVSPSDTRELVLRESKKTPSVSGLAVIPQATSNTVNELNFTASEFVSAFKASANGFQPWPTTQDFCHPLTKGGVECVFHVTPLISLSVESETERSKARTIVLLGGAGSDSPLSALNVMKASLIFVTVISPQLETAERGDLVLSMINEALDAKGTDVERRIGDVKYTATSVIFFILKASPSHAQR